MRDKYLLHIVNETINTVGLLRDIVYTYEHMEIITSKWTIILDGKTLWFILFSIFLF